MSEQKNDPVRESERDSVFRDDKGSGIGAVAGGGGIDDPIPPKVEPIGEDRARQGPIPDEHMREGWGGPGETYASGQGPNAREEGEQRQDKAFAEGKPPAGLD